MLICLFLVQSRCSSNGINVQDMYFLLLQEHLRTDEQIEGGFHWPKDKPCDHNMKSHDPIKSMWCSS